MKIKVFFSDTGSVNMQIAEKSEKTANKTTPNSPNWENDFLSELVRENCLEMDELSCFPIS